MRSLSKRLQHFKSALKRPMVFGMIHVHALPGTPMNKLSVQDIVKKAKQEAAVYKSAGIDGLIVENMHDLPYIQASRGMGSEVVASMTRACDAVREEVGEEMPVGVQILSGANREALAVAYTTGLSFIRAEGYVFSHVGDEGLTHACAGELLRYRRSIGADGHVEVLADIKKKHCSHSITADVSLSETAQAAEFFLADGVIVTGTATGHPTSPADVSDVTDSVQMPVLVGSGVTASNVHEYAHTAHGLIVGSHFKASGRWDGEVDSTRVQEFMNALQSI